MKNLKYLFLIVLLFITVNIQSQVGIGTENPDNSSMLDIQSDAKGVLIPRMTTAQRTVISSPATGLLVFDNTTQSFWFYSGSWTELATGSPDEIIDVDGDTKVAVEQNTDEDNIRFSTDGNERMTIDKDGNTRIGNGTDNTYIEADGSLSYEGTATRYEDLTVPVTSTKAGTSDIPEFEILSNSGGSVGVWVSWFQKSKEEELYFTVQIPHGRKYDTEIFPHVHWAAEGDLSGNVVWGLEYVWSNVGEVFGETQIIYGSSASSLIGTPATAKKHVLTAFTGNGATGGIEGIDKTLSSMLLCRIFRAVDHLEDTYSGRVGLLQIDFHIEYDADGSRELYIK